MTNYARYWDLSEMERAALTHDEVKTYLDVELMERGALRPKAPALEATVAADLPTHRCFTIKHSSYREMEIAFATTAAAEAFLALGPLLVENDYEAGSVKYAAPLAGASIAPLDLATRDDILAARTLLRENNARKLRNDKAQREYEKAVEAQDKETRAIWDDWHACRSQVEKHHRVMETYATYVAMTKGDEQLAWKFLLKAFPESEARAAFTFTGQPVPVPTPAPDAF